MVLAENAYLWEWGSDVLDHIFFVQARENVTWVDFKDRPPTRSLDLGCGVSTVLFVPPSDSC